MTPANEPAGRKIFMVHNPHYGHTLASTGDRDFVCCGRDHRASVSKAANLRGETSWLVNPGTIAGIGAPPAYVLGDPARMEFSVKTVDAEPA